MASDGFGREVLRLAVPAFGALAAPSLLLLTDASFVGSLGTNALAGYAGGSSAFGVAAGLSYFLAYASTSVVARRYGAGQHREALADGINYITLGLLIGVAVAAALWFGSGTFVTWIGVNDQALPHAIDWLHGAALGTPGMIASMAAIGMFRGMQDTRITFWVTLGTVLLNMVLCGVFIFGTHLGTFGAGLAVSVAETAGFLGYFAMLARYARSIGAPMVPTHLQGLREAFITGLPLLWRSLALRTVLLGTSVVAARLGAHELAAFYVSLTVWYVLANLLDAIAIAAQAMIGKRLGASQGHLVHAVVRRLLQWAVGYGAIVGVLTMLLAPVVPPLFSADPDVQHLITVCLLMVGVHQPLSALVFLLDGVLVGSGDTRYLAVVLTAGMTVFLPLAWSVVHFDFGVVGLWCAMIAFMSTRGVLMWKRARSDEWIVEGATR